MTLQIPTGPGLLPWQKLVNVVVVQHKTRKKELLIQFSTIPLLTKEVAECNHLQTTRPLSFLTSPQKPTEVSVPIDSKQALGVAETNSSTSRTRKDVVSVQNSLKELARSKPLSIP